MALVVDAQITALAETILADTGIVVYKNHVKAELKAEYDKALAAKEKELKHKFEYEVAQLEIKGVKTDLLQSQFSVWSAGVPAPTDGGLALQSSTKLAIAAVTTDSTGKKATQSNDGKGLVE
jgi:hypothetical protein